MAVVELKEAVMGSFSSVLSVFEAGSDIIKVFYCPPLEGP
jgi:hypothetical protein